MSVPFSYHDLLETFPRPGCVICNLLLRDADRYLDALLYEHVTDPDIQRAFCEGRGFCNHHSWQLTRYRGGVLGIAVLYGLVLDEVLEDVEQNRWATTAPGPLSRLLSPEPGASLAAKLAPTGACMVCETLEQSERHYVHTLGEFISDTPLQDAYSRSDGLCLPHFRQIVRETRDGERLQRFISLQRSIWLKLRAELQEFKRKYDFTHASETMGAEGTSWARTLAALAGGEGVFAARQK